MSDQYESHESVWINRDIVRNKLAEQINSLRGHLKHFKTLALHYRTSCQVKSNKKYLSH